MHACSLFAWALTAIFLIESPFFSDKPYPNSSQSSPLISGLCHDNSSFSFADYQWRFHYGNDRLDRTLHQFTPLLLAITWVLLVPNLIVARSYRFQPWQKFRLMKFLAGTSSAILRISMRIILGLFRPWITSRTRIPLRSGTELIGGNSDQDKENSDEAQTSAKPKKYTKVPLDVIHTYLLEGIYPPDAKDCQKRVIRNRAKNFGLSGEAKLTYNGKIVITDEKLKRDILIECHAGHVGVNKTTDKISERYYWPSITGDVKHFIQTCDRCQKVNPSLKSGAKVVLKPVQMKPDTFRQWGIDIVGPLTPTAEGHKYILAATDYFSKWPEAVAIKRKDAKSIATFLHDLYCRFGAADVIISDQGREFVNGDHVACSDWDLKLPGILFAARTTKQRSTKHSPYKIVFGREATLPKQLEMQEHVPIVEANEQLMEALSEKRVELFQDVADNIADAQRKYKQHYDAKHNDAEKVELKEGMEVLLKNSAKEQRKANKFSAEPNFLGPYRIAKITTNGLCRLVNENGKELKNAYNPTKLRPYFRPTGEIGPQIVDADPPTDTGIAAEITNPLPLKKRRVEMSDSVHGAVGSALQSLAEDTTLAAPLSPARTIDSNSSDPDYWLPDFQLGHGHRNRILNFTDCVQAWLSDSIIEAACRCIKIGDVLGGLLNPATLHCRPLLPDSIFAQIFHVDSNHWVLASNLQTDKPSTIRIYDSMGKGTRPLLSFLHQLAKFCRLRSDTMTVEAADVDQQPNSCDCGLYALAFLVALCDGVDPTSIKLAPGEDLRRHLAACLEKGFMDAFPSTPRSAKQKVLAVSDVELHCICRGIEFGGEMVCCDRCGLWLHMDCTKSPVDRSDNAKWFCHICEEMLLNLDIK